MDKILRIEENTFTLEKDSYAYDGFEIVTEDQTIRIGIENGQSCCEQWGCVITNDDTVEFIGATILGVSLTDKNMYNKQIEALEYIDAGGVMFVNIETDKGLLQFCAYNSHNGYYGHDAVLISKQLNHEITL